MQTSQERKAAEFKALHEGEPFVIPNPWDIGSARVLEGLGFRALATTSAGFAYTLGRLDGQVTLEELAQHAAAVDGATSLPVSVDLENGFGAEPEAAAAAVTAIAATGAVGASIEDFDPAGEIYAFDHAVERVAAACEAADRLPFEFTLTARAENHLRGNPDLDDTIARLQAYERAGAEVLYAPGLGHATEISAIAEATSRPLNVLGHPGLTVDEIVAAGGRRISMGSGLAWIAAEALVTAAERLRDHGEFTAAERSLPFRDWLAP